MCAKKGFEQFCGPKHKIIIFPLVDDEKTQNIHV